MRDEVLVCVELGDMVEVVETVAVEDDVSVLLGVDVVDCDPVHEEELVCVEVEVEEMVAVFVWVKLAVLV